MKAIKSFIKRLQSKQWVKISAFILILSVFFFTQVFAAGTEQERHKKAAELVFSFLELLSRIWVLLAGIAGKLMTNDMVYGSRLHMDQFLWKLRNIFKNFANFSLLGVLLRGIIQFMTKKWWSIQKLITQTLIAGVLIQASWFLVAATLDISTVITSAIWAFPSNFINKSSIQENEIYKNLAEKIHNHYIKLNKPDDNWKSKVTSEIMIWREDEWVDKDFWEKLMPKSDSIAGPLIYIWAATLNTQKALSNNATVNSKSVLTTSVIQLLMTGLFSITLILLIIVNILRIAILRVFIPLSPLFILLITIGKGDKISNMGKSQFLKSFGLKSILHAIFKPALLTAVLSFILILLVSMQSLMNPTQKNININWTSISTVEGSAYMENEWIFSVEINDSFFAETGKNIFSWLIIYFVCLFMMRYLVKTAAKTGWWVIESTMDKTTKIVEHMATTTPVFGHYSYWAMQQSGTEILRQFWEKSEINLDFGRNSQWAGKISNKWFEEAMAKLTWAIIWSDSDFNSLARSKPNDLFAKTKSMIANNWLSPEIRQERENRVFNPLENKNSIKVGGNKRLIFIKGKEETFANLTPGSLKDIHIELWWDPKKYVPKNHNDFMNNVKNRIYDSSTE